MFPRRHSGTLVAALLGGAWALAGCASLPATPEPVLPKVPDAPDGQISGIAIFPAARCVLDVNEKLTVQFFYDMPEAPCQVFCRLGAGDADYGELYAHGFGVGGAACPGLVDGDGILEQSCSVSYNARRDKRGLDDADYPRTYRITNLTFTVYGGTLAGDEKRPLYFERDDDSGRRVHSVPIDVTWRLAKTPFRDTRRAVERAGWRQVLELYPDAVLPEPPPKKARAKRNVPDPATAPP